MKKRLFKIATLILVVVMLASLLIPVASARWERESFNWGRWRYATGAQTFAQGWRQIDGTWYLFQANSWMVQSQFRQYGGSWYWLDANGAMATGWARPGGGSNPWYYFNPDGSMRTGWLYWNGSWYWLHTAATLAQLGGGNFSDLVVTNDPLWANWPRPSTPSWFDEAGNWFPGTPGLGAMAANVTLSIGGQTYHFNANGVMAEAPSHNAWRRTTAAGFGDQTFWFLFDAYGARLYGWQLWNGQWYWLHTGGADGTAGDSYPVGSMATGRVTTAASRVDVFHDVNGNWLGRAVG